MATANEPIDSLRELLPFFQQRDDATCFELTDSLLAHPRSGPICRLVANCMRAELHRGNEDYGEAEDEYQEAIQAGDECSGQMRRSEWYVAYHPRAHLGLISIWHRILKTDLTQIQDLLAETREKFKALSSTIPDMPAQIDAVEGVFHRHVGDSSTALTYLTRAVEGIKSVRVNWYVYWHPEHMEAHRALVYLMTPRRQSEGRPLADKLLLKPGLDSWSQAAALAARLHHRLAMFLQGNGQKNSGPDELDADLAHMAVAGRRSLDPTLRTEGMMLRAVWSGANENQSACLAALADLANDESWDPNLKFLRGVETAVIQQNWLPNEDNSGPIRELCSRGINELDGLRDGLRAYGYPSKYLDACQETLIAARDGSQHNRPIAWCEDPLVMLRARLWP